MVFVLLGVDATLSDGYGIWEHFTVPGKWNIFRVISGIYGCVYKTLKCNLLVVEHRVVVMTAGSHQDNPKLNHMGSQF